MSATDAVLARGKRSRSRKQGQGPDFSNLPECVAEMKRTFLDTDVGPNHLNNYPDLRRRLEASEKKLPPLYRKNAFQPFKEVLDSLGADGFQMLLQRDESAVMEDIAQAILQNGEGYQERATDGFQEVVSDLYDGFLSDENRWGMKKPDISKIAPLVKWGNPEDGPYTWPVDITSQFFSINTAIVNLPPSVSRYGVLGWASLGHETAGHDILHADEGLLAEMQQALWQALKDAKLPRGLPEYWAERIDETASDVLGILNMGPAAGIGIIGLLRGVRGSRGDAVLSTVGPDGDEHPCDIVRGYLAASVVRLLSFDGRDAWADAIEAETDRDRSSSINLGGRVVTVEDAKKSAEIAAKTISKGKMKAMGYRPFLDIQDWKNEDEAVVGELVLPLTTSASLEDSLAGGYYAAHAVAAAVVAALRKGADLPVIFDRMQLLLKIMHDKNPSWGPLYIAHPGVVWKRPASRPLEA
jgi:hypothetical protein